MVFTIGVQVNPPSIDCSQLSTLPTSPERVSVPAFAPEQTVASEVTAPSTVAGLTVIVAEPEGTAAQTPLCTCARNNVVVIRFKYV